MPRSLKLHPHCISKVKLALRRNGFPSQRALAEDAGFALATVNNFLTGKAVDYSTFEELSRKLALDWREIANLDFDALCQSNQENHQISHVQTNLPSLYPSGALPIDSPFYVKRSPIEEQVYQEIKKPGALVRIKAPREMGKTSLMLRILDFAKRLGYFRVCLNLEQVDQAILSNLNQFLRWLCSTTARQLDIKPQLNEYWDEDLGSKISCTSYFQDYLLEEINAPIILALDEVNYIFEHEQVAKEFLALLRSWYEEAKTLAIWQKLRLVVVNSTEIYVSLDINQSPFNVGLPVELKRFNQEEVQELTQRYELDSINEEKAQQLMNMVDGHPALIQIALYNLHQGQISFLELLETAPTISGVYSNHLQRHLVNLYAQPNLNNAFRSIVNSDEPISLDPMLTYKLKSMGLIQLQGNKVMVSCELYRQYFSNNL